MLSLEYVYTATKIPQKYAKIVVPILWFSPTNGLKLNIDGAFFPQNLIAGIDGVIKNSNVQWVVGFYIKTTSLNPTMSELQALVQGLHLAKDKNITLAEIETDSIDLIYQLHYASPLYTNLVYSYRLMLKELGN